MRITSRSEPEVIRQPVTEAARTTSAIQLNSAGAWPLGPEVKSAAMTTPSAATRDASVRFAVGVVKAALSPWHSVNGLLATLGSGPRTKEKQDVVEGAFRILARVWLRYPQHGHIQAATREVLERAAGHVSLAQESSAVHCAYELADLGFVTRSFRARLGKDDGGSPRLAAFFGSIDDLDLYRNATPLTDAELESALARVTPLANRARDAAETLESDGGSASSLIKHVRKGRDVSAWIRDIVDSHLAEAQVQEDSAERTMRQYRHVTTSRMAAFEHALLENPPDALLRVARKKRDLAADIRSGVRNIRYELEALARAVSTLTSVAEEASRDLSAKG